MSVDQALTRLSKTYKTSRCAARFSLTGVSRITHWRSGVTGNRDPLRPTPVLQRVMQHHPLVAHLPIGNLQHHVQHAEDTSQDKHFDEGNHNCCSPPFTFL